MSVEVPPEVRALGRERDRARAARDFARADALRDRIAAAGFQVRDTPEGGVLSPAAPAKPAGARPAEPARPADVPSVLDRPEEYDASVDWLVEGWPQDAVRGIDSFRRHEGTAHVQHVVVDLTGHRGWPEGVEVVRLVEGTGWAAARNAGLLRSLGGVVLVADGSVEATGDVIGPLLRALSDRAVGITGPFGIVSGDLREFHPSDGPDVDAIEGYLMAFRRDLLRDGLRFDEKFRWYRTADIELSFQVKARGLRATVTSVPLRRHEHRMWESTSPHDRDRFSKRNFYRFLDRWRGRTDLLVSGG